MQHKNVGLKPIRRAKSIKERLHLLECRLPSSIPMKFMGNYEVKTSTDRELDEFKTRIRETSKYSLAMFTREAVGAGHRRYVRSVGFIPHQSYC